jgi:DNA polymerase III subunit epsilon
MYMFFDTETTGMPRNYKAPLSDLNNWPRLVQIAWLLVEDSAKEIENAEYIIKPDGFTIPKDAAKIHGITTEMARQDGIELETVLNAIEPIVKGAKLLVAHNMQYDEKILGAEFLRAGYTNPLETKKRKCTMQAATNYCRLPGPYGFKWPTLQELHLKLFRKSFEGAHTALADVRACAACYFELKRLKIVR